MNDAEDEYDEDADESDQAIRNGTVVAWVDWDSGGPGGGSGRVAAYELNGKFYVSHDAGVDRYNTFEAAVRGGWIWETDVTTELWVADKYKEAHRVVSEGRRRRK